MYSCAFTLEKNAVLMCVLLLLGTPDIREPPEALVRTDRGQYGAEDSRNAGHCQESQGKLSSQRPMKTSNW